MTQRLHKPQSVKVYRVGGSVRDELLGREIVDRDWVVVGATPEMLIASDYKPVGRDFPVFLHRETGEEYALARTERKHGRGYHGFEFFASPDVSLEEDLARRDLTINAMARDEDGRLIDLFGGESDLRAGILRHVSPAFVEDPLRVLRVARFAARFAFVVAAQTMELMRALVESGELAELQPERVWQELSRGLMEPHPALMLAVLRECGALGQLLPEVDALYGERSLAARPGNRGAALSRALEYAAANGFSLPVRYSILGCIFSAAVVPQGSDASRRAPSISAVRAVESISSRLRVPIECRDAARLAARWRSAVDRIAALQPAKLLDLLMAADALRRPERLEGLLKACESAAAGLDEPTTPYAAARLVAEAREVVKSVDAGAIARAESSKRKPPALENRDAIANAVRAARLDALRAWRRMMRQRADGDR